MQSNCGFCTPGTPYGLQLDANIAASNMQIATKQASNIKVNMHSTGGLKGLLTLNNCNDATLNKLDSVYISAPLLGDRAKVSNWKYLIRTEAKFFPLLHQFIDKYNNTAHSQTNKAELSVEQSSKPLEITLCINMNDDWVELPTIEEIKKLADKVKSHNESSTGRKINLQFSFTDGEHFDQHWNYTNPENVRLGPWQADWNGTMRLDSEKMLIAISEHNGELLHDIVLDGEEYDENGEIVYKGQCKGGKRHGTGTMYNKKWQD